MPLDATDRRILELLQQEGRMTNARLAEEVSISPSATLERVRRLERLGVIQGYRAIVDPEKVGRATTAFVSISLEAHGREALESFESQVQAFPEVVGCYHVSGSQDLLLKVVVKDIPTYRAFVVEQLSRLPNLGHVETSFVLETIKETTVLPVEGVEEDGEGR